MISAQQEAAMQMANDRSSKRRQDKTNPHVINVNDGRLMPNTPRLRKHKDYRVYMGPKDADTELRMKWLAGAGRRSPMVVDSSEPAEVFDLGKATAADLVLFAFENYGMILDENTPIVELRKAVKATAEKLAAAESESLV